MKTYNENNKPYQPYYYCRNARVFNIKRLVLFCLNRNIALDYETIMFGSNKCCHAGDFVEMKDGYYFVARPIGQASITI